MTIIFIAELFIMSAVVMNDIFPLTTKTMFFAGSYYKALYGIIEVAYNKTWFRQLKVWLVPRTPYLAALDPSHHARNPFAWLRSGCLVGGHAVRHGTGMWRSLYIELGHS